MAADHTTDKEIAGSSDGVKSPFLFADEAANYLRITLRTLMSLKTSGTGPAYRKHGGRVVYHKDDLDLWSARRRYFSSSKRGDE
jgi:excisionase family DNA binding protein